MQLLRRRRGYYLLLPLREVRRDHLLAEFRVRLELLISHVEHLRWERAAVREAEVGGPQILEERMHQRLHRCQALIWAIHKELRHQVDRLLRDTGTEHLGPGVS